MTVLAAAHALRNHFAFRDTSLRHLTDLAEMARGDARVLAFGTTERIRSVFLVLLRGRALAQLAEVGLADSVFEFTPGDVFWTGLVPTLAQMGTMQRTARRARSPRGRPFTFALEDRDVEVTAVAAEGALILPLTRQVLSAAANASTSFAMSVVLVQPPDQQMTLYHVLAAAGAP